jgi:DNA (cytosine-5)-methyltransferase 1
VSLSIGSLFSGIGGLELGLERAGLGPVVWQAESDPAARAVLEAWWPRAHRFHDVREIDGRTTAVDVVCGGFPCQDLSSAGRRAGLSGERSGLWWEFRRIVRELRPRYVFVENVNSGRRAWLPVVRRSLWRAGYASLPVRVSAADVGAPHERERVFVLAYPHGQRELQPGGRLGEERGRARNGGRAVAVAHGVRLIRGPDLKAPTRAARGDAAERDHPWTAEPGMGRVAHGVSGRVDRLRLLGNACVPQQASAAWRLLAGRVGVTW